LQDRLVYFRSDTSTPSADTALPRDPDDAFLVVVLALDSPSDLYPEDLEWTFVDGSQREFRSAGFGIPLQGPSGAAVFSLFGRLIAGPATVTSPGDRAVFALIFVVPRGTLGGTIVSPQGETATFMTVDPSVGFDPAQISTAKFESSYIEQPTGSEDWIVTEE
jgi:hypothetical protein